MYQNCIQSITRNGASVLFILVILLSIVGVIEVPTESLVAYISTHATSGFIAVMAAMLFATVVAPVALLPLIPVIAPMLGPFLTAIASWVGWTLGAVIAFGIARYGGKPLLLRFVSIESLERYESRIPEDAHFLVILALRLVVPVDILSYALGLFSTVRLGVYTVASSLGILWFSFAFSYLGYAYNTNNTVLFVGYSVASAIIFAGAFWYTFRAVKRGVPGKE
jgi:uncharacterized membrane protein YdjX (TVP38/TMEM64 family)